MSHTDPLPARQLLPGMRVLLAVAGGLVLLAGFQLFVFSERTATYFAWTIAEPLTAAVLGGAYWSSALIEFTAARATRWADARIAVPTVFVFTTATLVATLTHLDKFHLGAEHAVSTRAVTWAWIAIYAVVPVCLAWLWVVQSRQPGADPPRLRRLPGWVVVLVVVQAVVLVPVGSWLMLAPLSAATAWPWALTPLTATVVGAWALSLGVAAAHSLLEGDPARLRPAAYASIALAVLEAIALARYGDAMRWDSVGAVAFVGFLVVAFATGVGSLAAQRRGVTARRGRVATTG